MKRGMKLISNAVLLATIVNINLYASSKDWENIDNLEKSGILPFHSLIYSPLV